MKKLLAILLLSVLVLGTLVSCASTDTTDGGKDTSSADTLDSSTGGDKIVINEETLDGYEYNILVTGNVDYNRNYGSDFYFEENSNDRLSSAKQNWIANTEAKFDIKIVVEDKLKWNGANGTGLGYQELVEVDTAQEARYDHCMIGSYDVAKLAQHALLTDISTFDWINLENSWWDQVATKDLTIQGKLYYTTGDISVVDNIFTHCVLFNKEMIKSHNLDNPYDYVRNDTWTLDKFSSLVKAGSNTDGVGDDSTKVYGLLTWNDSLLQILASADERICRVDETGSLVLTVYNERTQSLYDTYNTLALDPAYSINYQTGRPSGEWDTFRKDLFDSNRALLYPTLFSTIVHHRDSKTDFGILPYPKFDDSQENYGHLISAFHSNFFCIPTIIEDSDITGSVAEYMAYMGQKTTKPAYYEDTLQGQYFRDEESSDMLDIIFASRAYDAGINYKIGSISTKIGKLHSETSSSLTQIYNASQGIAQATIDQINNDFKLD